MINVNKPYLPNIKKYQKYVSSIYDNQWITNHGPLEKELTIRLSEYLGVKNLILVSNGTLALSLAYKLLHLRESVITTPFSFVATTSSLVWDNLQPVFSDIDPRTLNLDCSKIEDKISHRIKGIVPVHIFGNACEINYFTSLASKNNLKVVYDASHAFGVKYQGKNILNYGDISTLSLHATKLFHTVEGGALVINDEEIFEDAKNIRNFGYNSAGEISSLGINAKLSEFHAAMGLAVLDDIEAILIKRQELVEHYEASLKDIFEFQKLNPDATRNYSYFPVLFECESSLDKCLRHLNKSGIFPKRYFTPSLDKLNYLSDTHDVPNSWDISSRTLCLPLYFDLSIKDVDLITDKIKEVML
ncbi:hypothetical protein LCGC14_1064140 [marine sediment metagenome]|uniref:Aminotransferase DegT n=1 Tax=marine sediment metagenome TaxID=412755 RepID=A0A0F9Q357_9ZZZZ